MSARKQGWYQAASLTRIYFYNGEPTCVATYASNLDLAHDAANDAVGYTLSLDTWFCTVDSPHSGLLTENDEQLAWSCASGLMLTGILESEES